MDDFAKLYRAADVGQVLVVLDSGDEGPEISVQFKPPGLGVCSIKMGFKDTDDGWDKAEAAFGKVDEEWALGAARATIESSPVGSISRTLRDAETKPAEVQEAAQ